MLSALIWVPILGAALIGFLPVSISPKLCRRVALVFASMAFLWTVVLAIQFDPVSVNQQFSEFIPWIDALGLNYHIGIDGLSLPLLMLNGLLTCIAIYSSDVAQQRSRFYYSFIFVLNVGVK